MACSENSESGTQAGACCGGCGCGPQSPPWLAALLDPALAGLMVRRFWTRILRGAGAGLLAGAALALFGETVLGPLGPLLSGPWLRFHGAAVLPALMAAGLLLALHPGTRGRRTAWAAALLALGGLANGFLDLGSASFTEGGWVHGIVLVLAGLPLAWLAQGAGAALARRR